MEYLIAYLPGHVRSMYITKPLAMMFISLRQLYIPKYEAMLTNVFTCQKLFGSCHMTDHVIKQENIS